jgi:hypothetical protein
MFKEDPTFQRNIGKLDVNYNFYVTGYIPIRTPARKLTATPTPIAGTPAGFFIQQEDKSAKYMDNQPKGNLPFMKPEDAQYFDKLLVRHFAYLL